MVSHHQAHPAPETVRRALALAEVLADETPRLRGRPTALSEGGFIRRIEDRPTLHLDDFSDISIPTCYFETLEHLEDRARVRAGEGDVVASNVEPEPGYEEYCRRSLGLGEVAWLRARTLGRRTSLALACWSDRELRETLVSLFRERRLDYIHPHMGSFAVWALAALLSAAAGRAVHVIAPPPALARAVNDKVWFSSVIRRLLGDEWIPRTEEAYNFATASVLVRELASEAERIVIKLPDSAGGGGNLVVDPAPLRRLSLGALRARLKALMQPLEWEGRRRILIGAWESDVLASPSVQLWLPPIGAGSPVVEGLFEQVLEGEQGFFVGNRPARLPKRVADRIVEAGWLVARLLQELGYVGRCSFDLLLVGPDLGRCRVEFIECNGRWGGTSLPMSLMNRLFGDWASREYRCMEHRLAPGEGDTFVDFVHAAGETLYDTRTGRGELILFNAAGLANREIAVIRVDGDPQEPVIENRGLVPKRSVTEARTSPP